MITQLLPAPEAPAVEWGALSPLIVVVAIGIIGVLIEAFAPRGQRQLLHLILAVGGLGAAAVLVVSRFMALGQSGPRALVSGEIVEDGLGLAAQLALTIIGILAVLIMADRTEAGDGAFVAQPADRPGSADEALSTRAGMVRTEYFPLTVLAIAGMMVFASANSMLTLFISLEVMSLPLYVLAAMARRRRLLSQEAALKYFILGAFSSAFFLMGAALVYGATAEVQLGRIFQAMQGLPSFNLMLLVGVLLVLVGLLFKVGAAPFHAWTPDVYQGAPTPVTGFMAAGVKIAAFTALTRFFYLVAGGFTWSLEIATWTIAILTMVVGTVVGILSTDIKRMLAYSSIAHAGFILIGVFALNGAAVPAIAFYLVTYGFATVGAFGVISLVRRRGAEGEALGEANALESWAGLGRTNPVLATSMMIFLLSFAGIPLTGGFIGKFTVFAAGIGGGLTPLVVVAVLASAATAFFYLRLMVLMFFTPPTGETLVVKSQGMTSVAVMVCAVATVILGVFPGPVLQLLAQATIVLS